MSTEPNNDSATRIIVHTSFNASDLRAEEVDFDRRESEEAEKRRRKEIEEEELRQRREEGCMVYVKKSTLESREFLIYEYWLSVWGHRGEPFESHRDAFFRWKKQHLDQDYRLKCPDSANPNAVRSTPNEIKKAPVSRGGVPQPSDPKKAPPSGSFVGWSCPFLWCDVKAYMGNPDMVEKVVSAMSTMIDRFAPYHIKTHRCLKTIVDNIRALALYEDADIAQIDKSIQTIFSELWEIPTKDPSKPGSFTHAFRFSDYTKCVPTHIRTACTRTPSTTIAIVEK